MIDSKITIFRIASEHSNGDQTLAIEVDLSNKNLYAYNLEEDEIDKKSRGILKVINSDIADDIQKKLKIKLSEFDVEVINTDPIKMPLW